MACFSSDNVTFTIRDGTDPAANVEISQAVSALTAPTGQDLVVDLWAVKATLVTDATVATRTVTFTIDDGAGNVLFTKVSPATQAASLTRVYYFYRDLVTEDASFDAGGNIKLRLPPIPLKPAWRFITSTANRQSTDNWGAPKLITIERVV